jgi:DNA-binding response OmpR family regulator
MKHALIIEDNLLVSRFLEDRLAALGFGSFDHVWTEDDAVAAAMRRLPDLVIIGDDLTEGCGFNAALRILSFGDVPALVISAGRAATHRTLPCDASIQGPFSLQDIDRLVGALDGASADLAR